MDSEWVGTPEVPVSLGSHRWRAGCWTHVCMESGWVASGCLLCTCVCFSLVGFLVQPPVTSLHPAQGILLITGVGCWSRFPSHPFPKVWLWVVPIPKTFPLWREKRKSFLSFSLTSLLLYYLLRPEWPTDSNGCRSEDGKKCQQFWNNQTDVSGELENLYPATLKKMALPVYSESQYRNTNDVEIEWHSSFSFLLSWFILILKVNMTNYSLCKLSDIFYACTLFFFSHKSVN